MDDTELIDNAEEVEEIEENEDIISTNEEQTSVNQVEASEEVEQAPESNVNMEFDIYDELSEVSEDSEEFSTDYQQLIDNTETIISLLSISEDDIYDSAYDYNVSSSVVQCFLLACVFGCFVCSALFRKW